jgi:hypothetical protein
MGLCVVFLIVVPAAALLHFPLVTRLQSPGEAPARLHRAGIEVHRALLRGATAEREGEVLCFESIAARGGRSRNDVTLTVRTVTLPKSAGNRASSAA